MIALNSRLSPRRFLQLFFGCPKTRTYANRLLLEPLENRDLLNGTPLVNSQSSTQALYVEGLFETLLQRPADAVGLTSGRLLCRRLPCPQCLCDRKQP